MRVLVVEDEVRLAENLTAGLREGAGYAVDVVHNGLHALEHLQAASYDLVVLDLMLPGCTGDDVLLQFRRSDQETPVLVLTARVGSLSTIDLLNAGADDYMTKPFDLGELLARARALVRRGKGLRHSVMEAGAVRLDTAGQAVTVAGQPVDLSPTEYRILAYLLHRPRTVVSKRELLEHLYDFTWEHHSNVVEAHISNLRRKLRVAEDIPVLETLRGRGYRLACTPEPR